MDSSEQWMRVPHPNAPSSPHGPELDARIDDAGVALTYVEAKWEAGLGKGRGAVGGSYDDQVVLRRDAFRKDPCLSQDTRRLIVLGVSKREA